MIPGAEPTRKSHVDDEEEPPDPAAVEGERRSRELDPWGVMAFELSIVLKGLEKTLGDAMRRLKGRTGGIGRGSSRESSPRIR